MSDCIVFISSCSLLKQALLTSIIFLNSVNIFTTNILNSVSDKLLISVSLFSVVPFFFFSIESSFSAFSLCLTFSASNNLGKTVIF